MMTNDLFDFCFKNVDNPVISRRIRNCMGNCTGFTEGVRTADLRVHNMKQRITFVDMKPGDMKSRFYNELDQIVT